MGIREYGYRFGYTSAQIDLMLTDQPVIDYGSGKKKKGSMIASRADVAEMENLTSSWEKKRHGRSFVGKEVKLDDFMKGK